MRKHLRSATAFQRRFIIHVVEARSYRDRMIDEQVNRVSRRELLQVARERFGGLLCQIPDYDNGEVLRDSLGRGTHQRLVIDE